MSLVMSSQQSQNVNESHSSFSNHKSKTAFTQTGSTSTSSSMNILSSKSSVAKFEPNAVMSTSPTLHSTRLLPTMLAGGLAGCVSKTAMAPLSRLTILYQVDSALSSSSHPGPLTSSPDRILRNLNIAQLTQRIIRDEGFFSLWKGNLTSVLHRFPYSAINFSVYELGKVSLQRYFGFEEGIFLRFVCGAAGGAAACMACYPLDIIRTRLTISSISMSSSSSHHNIRDTITSSIQHILKTEGFRGLYRGMGVSLGVCVPNLAIGFATYGTVKDYLIHRSPYSLVRNSERTNLSLIGALVSGSCSGIISSAIVYPADVIRRRMQVRGLTDSSAIMGRARVWSEITTLYHIEGVRGFYRGIVPELIKVTPSVGITFCVYEIVLKFFSESNK